MTISPTARPTETAGAADWLHCPRCRMLLYRRRFERELSVCPDCGHHARLDARARLDQLLDPGSVRTFGNLSAVVEDPLDFTDVRPYRERLAEARAACDLDDAAVCATGTVHDHQVVVVAMDFGFMGGSLGVALGSLIEQAAHRAREQRHPLVVLSASGGARMQEGALALMQMARTSQAFAALDAAGVFTVSVVTDPTYGGVAASFVPIADVVLAEPGARMGFAGPRVIAQTIGQSLPEGFQTAEFLLEHGLVDDVVTRAALRPALASLLAATRPKRARRTGPVPLVRDGADLPRRGAWESVRAVRTTGRPGTLEVVEEAMEGFYELHGDRLGGGDCRAVVAGVGLWDGVPVVVVGHQRGATTQERIARNFGMPRPEGYRKAARLMRLAEKLGLPVVTLIDTPGAYPGIDAERRGQAHAIADNLRLMARLTVPIISVVLGEGGSGGALGIGVADRMYALEDSIFSVISPEGCAAILWRDAGRARDAAEALQVDAASLLRHGLVEGIIPVSARSGDEVADAIRVTVSSALAQLTRLAPDELLARRAARYESFGTRPAAGQEVAR
ncbi:MAG: carboxyltransferase subunit alpha [Geodermatophilaceae bacterium]